MKKIILSQSTRKILKNHAENEEPNESCAILYGKENVISDVFLTENIIKSQTEFTISNEQLIKGYKIADENNVQVIGIFHSHPNSEAYPSKTDEKFMQVNPVVWMIYSGINKDFRAYVLESEIIEIEISE